MMNQLIACCGLDCKSCDARIATIEDNNELREETAQKWSMMNSSSDITAATINCLGCRMDGVKFAYCSFCGIRKCVQEKGYNTCGECSKLDSCMLVNSIFQHAPKAKENLLSINS